MQRRTLSVLFTEISGASEVFDCGFVVTYSNKAKRKMLGVKSKTLNQFGAVSSEVAKEMALGALKKNQIKYYFSNHWNCWSKQR